MMYTATRAAAISRGSPASEVRNACAVPWKVPSTEAGRPSPCSIRSICATASPRDAPRARLNEIVTAGNWLWWLLASGATGTVSSLTRVDSGTAVPLVPFT